jgi:hypothetical protein
VTVQTRQRLFEISYYDEKKKSEVVIIVTPFEQMDLRTYDNEVFVEHINKETRDIIAVYKLRDLYSVKFVTRKFLLDNELDPGETQ